MTQAAKALMIVTRLFRAGTLYECFNELNNVDCKATSEDLCHIVFDDGSAISINPGDRTLTVD